MAIDIALADNNSLMLSALGEYFDKDFRFSLVSTAGSAEGFLEAVLRVPVDVAVIDWQLSMLGAEKTIEILRSRSASTRILVYAQAREDDQVPTLAMAAGAAGFCSRSEPPEVLLDIAEKIAQGQMIFPFLDVRQLKKDPLDILTQREKTLLTALSQGKTNKELAFDLDISVNTVKFHLRNLFDKLDVKNRSQAIAFFYSSNLHLEITE